MLWNHTKKSVRGSNDIECDIPGRSWLIRLLGFRMYHSPKLTPVPDRISLISAPPKATPALLSAIRNAITSTSAGHQRSGTQDTDGSDKKGISWNDKKAKIKVEGWVYDGVYRFWLDGLRRKLVGGVKKDAVEL